MITDNHPERTEVMVLFRIISRRNWETLQSLHKAHPGSSVEHLYAGLYVLSIPAGAATHTSSPGGPHE
jgi:hypothetical protein